MASSARAPEECNVAVVMDNTVRIYGHSKDGHRPFIDGPYHFTSYAKALEFALDHDDKQLGRF